MAHLPSVRSFIFLATSAIWRQNLIELVEPGETGEVVWRSRKSLVNTVKQSVGAKAFGWLRRRKNDEKEGKTSESIPPEAIAGLYLRETPDRRLAIIISSSSNALDREDGVDGGASYDDGGLSGVEFGVVLEGSSSVSGAEEGQEKGGVNEVGETFGGEGSLGTTTSGPGENAGIEMMELGGEQKRFCSYLWYYCSTFFVLAWSSYVFTITCIYVILEYHVCVERLLPFVTTGKQLRRKKPNRTKRPQQRASVSSFLPSLPPPIPYRGPARGRA